MSKFDWSRDVTRWEVTLDGRTCLLLDGEASTAIRDLHERVHALETAPKVATAVREVLGDKMDDITALNTELTDLRSRVDAFIKWLDGERSGSCIIGHQETHTKILAKLRELGLANEEGHDD